MEIFQPKNLKYNWVGAFKVGFWASAALTVLSVIRLVKPGLNYGIDFRGGLEALVSFNDPNVSVGEVRESGGLHLRNRPGKKRVALDDFGVLGGLRVLRECSPVISFEVLGSDGDTFHSFKGLGDRDRQLHASKCNLTS